MKARWLVLAIACGAPPKPPPETTTPTNAGESVVGSGADDVVIGDARAVAARFVDEFCACADKACGIAANDRYQRRLARAPEANPPQTYAELQAQAQKLAECLARWK